MSPQLSWCLLVLAGFFEVGWAVGLKYTQGFTRLWPSVGTTAALVISIALLAASLRHLPVGTAYAVWVGIGAVGTAIVGILAFGESANAARLLSLLLIVMGVAGLKLSTSTG